MAQDVKIAVTGAGGRMGATLIRLIAGTDGLAVTGGLEAGGSPHIGQDLGLLAGLSAPLGIAATAEAARASRLAGRAFVTFIILLWISSALGGAIALGLLSAFPLGADLAAALRDAL
ncbi:MAG: hypothetical protein ACK4N1_18460, partial [Pseudorhizobium sp.]